MKSLHLPDGRTLVYELVRKRVKNINCRPKSDGIVYVSANPRTALAKIEEFLIEKAEFFFDAFEKLRRSENKSEINTARVNWLGVEYPVRIIGNSRETAVLDARECRVFTKHGDNAEYVLSLITSAVDARFLELCTELNAEVRAELEGFGLNPPPVRIAIKTMTSRWGSCTPGRGHISINRRLAAYPRLTVKSVFWHEYAHCWHPDHSDAFYGFLRKYFPEYFKWNALLKG